MLDRLVFRPSRHPIATPKQEILLDVPWGKLQVWCERTPACAEAEPEVSVLRFLGARGRAEMGTTDPLNRLPHARGEVWIANPPGFGASSGPVSLQRYAEAALHVFDAMQARAPGRKTWVYGQSFGTAAALHVAASRRVDWLVLKNVVPVPQLMRARAPFGLGWAADWLAGPLPPELDVMRNAALARAPALFLVSRGDALSPPEVQLRVRSVYRGESEACIVDGAHDQHVLAPLDEANYAAHALKALAG
jgi:hypothetical protein